MSQANRRERVSPNWRIKSLKATLSIEATPLHVRQRIPPPRNPSPPVIWVAHWRMTPGFPMTLAYRTVGLMLIVPAALDEIARLPPARRFRSDAVRRETRRRPLG